MKSIYYARLDSGGLLTTNLQLYTVRQAIKYWLQLEKDYKSKTFDENILKERYVFIVILCGTSVTQLLGQNCLKVKDNKVDNPKTLFREAIFDKERCTKTVFKKFENFIDDYDDCRHFGKTANRTKYQTVDDLNYERVKKWYQFTLEIWILLLNKLSDCAHEFSLDNIENSLLGDER